MSEADEIETAGPAPRRRRRAAAPVTEVAVAAEPETAPVGALTDGTVGEEAPVGELEAEPHEEEDGENRAYDLAWRSGLLNVLAIAGRELRAYFVSPVGWVLGAVLIVPISLFGYLGPVVSGQQATLSNVFSVLPVLFIFVMPLYTMRLLSEEQRSGTLEILLTSPVRDLEVVLGKWLGIVGFYILSIAFTLVYVFLLAHDVGITSQLHILGATVTAPDLEYGQILTGYIGAIVVGATFAAIGLLTSAVTQNQIIAAFVGVIALLLLWNLGYLGSVLQPPISDLASYLAANSHSNSFSTGQVALKDLVYFLSLTVGALFLAARVLESRRWR